MMPDEPPSKPPDDWATIWRSEMAGIASDAEALETWRGLANAWGRALSPAPHDSSGRAGANAKTGPEAAAAASARRIERRLAALAKRLFAIEQRLDTLEQSVTPAPRGKKRA